MKEKKKKGRSLYLRLFLTFYAVLFLGLAIISTAFVYFRQHVENEQQVESMLTQARSLAKSTFDYRAGRMQTNVYARLVEEYRDERTSIWIVDQLGFFLYITGMDSEQEQLSVDEIRSTLSAVIKEGQELRVVGAFNARFGDKQMITVATPVHGVDNVNIGAVYIHRQFDPITLDMLDTLLLAAAGMTFFLSALPLILLSRSVTKPLMEMATASQRYASGDFTGRVHSSRVREIDTLAVSLNKMAEDLAKLDQLRIGFVANVSHELRSPLTSMQGYVQGMLDGTIPKEDYEKYLGVVSDETKRLTRLVSDLLDLSKMESGNMPIKKTKFDICELLRRVLIKYEARIDAKNLEVDVIFRPEQLYVNADPDRIEQVVSNLIDNAIKFLHDGGTLSVYANSGNDVAYITVKDNGEGIAPEDLPFIFERFYKADKAHTSGGGTGLGLSIASKIIQRHGHTLACRSKRSEGTEFSFQLDLAKE